MHMFMQVVHERGFFLFGACSHFAISVVVSLLKGESMQWSH